MSLSTHVSLIGRLKHNGDSFAWQRFYDKYSGAIIGFARQRGCDEHSALDVLQETLMAVMRALPNFEYDRDKGRFRNWILTIVSNKVREAIRRSRADRLVPLEDADAEAAAVGAAAPDELEAGWRQALLEEALRQIDADPRTSAETVAIFRAVAIEGREAARVAADFGVKENAVYQIKSRLTARLQTMIATMEAGDLDSTDDIQA